LPVTTTVSIIRPAVPPGLSLKLCDVDEAAAADLEPSEDGEFDELSVFA
jgi:hypothetical protein